MKEARLTPLDVVKTIRQISDLADSGDYESAHSLEDKMFVQVLTEIGRPSTPQTTAQRLARTALTSTELDFPRPCA